MVISVVIGVVVVVLTVNSSLDSHIALYTSFRIVVYFGKAVVNVGCSSNISSRWCYCCCYPHLYNHKQSVVIQRYIYYSYVCTVGCEPIYYCMYTVLLVSGHTEIYLL